MLNEKPFEKNIEKGKETKKDERTPVATKSKDIDTKEKDAGRKKDKSGMGHLE